MKSYLELIPISAKVHKRQNRMIFLCITIAVFLVTSVFSMTDMALRMEKVRVVDHHGNWHIQLKNISEREAKMIRVRPDVEEVTWFDAVNDDLSRECRIDGADTVVCSSDESFLTETMNSLEEGNFPQNSGEILLTANAKDLFDVDLGDSVAIKTPSGSFDYIVSGFGGEAAFTSLTDQVGAFLNREAFQKFTGSLENAEVKPLYYVLFQKKVNCRKAIDDIRQQYVLTDDNISENTALLGLTGFSSNSYVMQMYLVAFILFLLILAAGVFMIAGSLNSKIAERSRFFGMLRCIGASRAQIKRFVRLEALNWCKTAVPAGVLSGILATWGLCTLLRFWGGGEFVEMPLFQVSAVGICSGVVVAILTVFLSAQAPAKRAARVSPMAAVSGNSEKEKTVRHRAGTRFFHIETALGISHAVSAKKNLILMTGSFALSIVLFLSFSTILLWTRQAIPSLREWTPDASIVSHDASCVIDEGLVGEIEALPGVKRAFGRMYLSVPAQYQGKNGSIDLISYEEYQFKFAKKDMTEGDLSKVKGDGGCVLTVFDGSNSLRVGDKIRLNGDLEGEELEVCGILETSPFDSNDTPTVICSEETFKRLTGKNAYAVIDVQLDGRKKSGTVDKIRALAGQEYRFLDRRETNQQAKGTYAMFHLFVYGFLSIIAMIAVLNIVNSISMSVSARLKQYGVMRAVGMD